ncbi:hypothetical protein TNCV_3424031 [Trichonephila clavipes]|nr:hypothetical protein TNCV_3424031 [Trichonephila clavipes]
MNSVSDCVLTIIEDLSRDAQDSVPILLSLFDATQALNQKLLSARSPDLSPIEPVWDDVKAAASTREC